jgi:CheY-like chemotaxis protein
LRALEEGRSTLASSAAEIMASILVIDDDALYRGTLRLILEDGGHRVMEAQDGTEGIGTYKERKPDVVITDLLMPDMDGDEVIRSIKRWDRNARIIAISGSGAFYDVNHADTARKLGAAAILRKLDSAQQVLAEVERALEGR